MVTLLLGLHVYVVEIQKKYTFRKIIMVLRNEKRDIDGIFGIEMSLNRT